MRSELIAIALSLLVVAVGMAIVIGTQSDQINKLQSDNKAWNYCLDDYAFNDSLRGFNECVKVYHAVNK